MFSVKFHLALDTHTVTLDSNALDLIDYTLTVVAQKKKKIAPAPALTVDPTRPDPGSPPPRAISRVRRTGMDQ
jgi:hypothetical protein